MKKTNTNSVSSYRLALDCVANTITTSVAYRLANADKQNSQVEQVDFAFKPGTVVENILLINPEKIRIKKYILDNVQDVFYNKETEDFYNFFKNIDIASEYEKIGSGCPSAFPCFSKNLLKAEIYRTNFVEKNQLFFDVTKLKTKKIMLDLTHFQLIITSVAKIKLPDFCDSCRYKSGSQCFRKFQDHELLEMNFNDFYEKNRKKSNYEELVKIFCEERKARENGCIKTFNINDKVKKIIANFFYNEHIEKFVKQFNNTNFRKELEQKSKKTLSESELQKIKLKDSCILDVVRMPEVYSTSDYFDDFDYKNY